MSPVPKRKLEAARPKVVAAMQTLERKIIQGEDTERCAAVLNRRAVWQGLSADDRMRWARLARMAGAFDTALAVLEHLRKTDPERTDVQTALAELAADLKARTEASDDEKALAERPDEDDAPLFAPDAVNPAQFPSAKGGPEGTETEVREPSDAGGQSDFHDTSVADADPDDDIASAAAPFVARRKREALLQGFLERFSGRADAFARQWADKAEGKQGYVPVRRALTHVDLEMHLSGNRTYGIYLLRADATVTTAVLDADLKTAFRNRLTAGQRAGIEKDRRFLFDRVRELLRGCGVEPLAEVSGGKGFHFWVFFSAPVPAGRARRLLDGVRQSIADKLTAFDLEVFPKQDHLSGKGLGNLVKLPLGVHRVSGRRSYFPECPDRSEEGQLRFLAEILPANPAEVKFGEAAPRAAVIADPRLTGKRGDLPELARLAGGCPPLAHIFGVCRDRGALSEREEKVLFQTVGFLPNAKAALHHLCGFQIDYNPHLVDYKLTRVRGTPLGCKRVHGLLAYDGPYCDFPEKKGYAHPLCHLQLDETATAPKSERVENLRAAIDNLKIAIADVERFLP